MGSVDCSSIERMRIMSLKSINRREFLRVAAGAAAGLQAGVAFAADQPGNDLGRRR